MSKSDEEELLERLGATETTMPPEEALQTTISYGLMRGRKPQVGSIVLRMSKECRKSLRALRAEHCQTRMK